MTHRARPFCSIVNERRFRPTTSTHIQLRVIFEHSDQQAASGGESSKVQQRWGGALVYLVALARYSSFLFPGGLEEGGFAHARRAGEGKSGAPTGAPSRNLSAGSIPAKQAKPGNPGGKRVRGRSGVEELVDSSGS